MTENYQGMCAKCSHRKSCKTPCAFVEQILKQDNRQPFFEYRGKDLNDQPIIVAKSKNWRHETNETNLDQYGKAYAGDKPEQTPFNTDADNPFANYKPKLNQTEVFINKFFLGRSYDDIAAELAVNVDTVVSMFHHAQQRMIQALKFADDRQKTIDYYKSLLERNEKSFGKLPKGQRWFIMNRVIGLTVPEIAELEGATAHRVNNGIKDVSDRMKSGNLIWLECSDQDRQAARQRIEQKRARDRKA
jgi:hypothetical protein